MNFTDILTVLVIVIAFFGESIFGFGGGLISIPLLSLLLGVRDGVTLALLFQFCMGLLIWKSYRYISWQAAKPMTISIIIGTIIGTYGLSRANVTMLQIVLAISILLFLIKMVWFNGLTIGNKHHTTGAATAGLAGGLLQGLIGTGGPALTMYLSSAIAKKVALRATLIYLLFIACSVRLVISLPEDLFTPRLMHLALLSAPFFLIAIGYGQRLQQKINEVYYRRGIYLILASSAIALFIKAIA